MLLVLGLLVAWLVAGYFALNLLLNDTTRYLYQYREMTSRNDDVSLIPGLFAGGESRAEVESQLLGAGLDSWNTSYARAPAEAETIQRFHLGAGGRNIACGSELFLTIGYDAQDRLISATIAQGGACL